MFTHCVIWLPREGLNVNNPVCSTAECGADKISAEPDPEGVEQLRCCAAPAGLRYSRLSVTPYSAVELPPKSWTNNF